MWRRPKSFPFETHAAGVEGDAEGEMAPGGEAAEGGGVEVEAGGRVAESGGETEEVERGRRVVWEGKL
ncbi:hypothetical protein L484_026682 [Morus notabilis]|uniref:Uncharacterized protein n=1 Tax=Morus notabilis TaxID=981085 RepID=W9SN04_9ROSA|nr:hypothetical protein L484_026682 [Morus notabilis]